MNDDFEQNENNKLFQNGKEESIEEESFKNREFIRAAEISERVVIKKNKILYKELRKDFNPIIRGFTGLIIGGVIGIILNQVIYSDETIVFCSILGCLFSVMAYLKKEKS
jgi:hypothetical protein